MRLSRLILLVSIVLLPGCGSDTGTDSTERTHLQVEGSRIECAMGTGAGNTPSPEATSLWCEYSYLECSDSRTYGLACETELASGTTTCNCYVDEQPLGEEFTMDEECPLLRDSVILEACGWTP